MVIPYKTAWFMSHRVREAMRSGESRRLTAAGPGRRLSYRGLHAVQARITGYHLAELDRHNYKCAVGAVSRVNTRLLLARLAEKGESKP